MSHESGKIEILAVDAEHIYLRYHRAKKDADRGRFMIYQRNDEAFWMDDLEPLNEETPRFAPSPPLALDEPPEGLEVAVGPPD